MFDMLRAKYGKLDSSVRWLDYPAEDFKDHFPKPYIYIKHRDKMKKFKECDFYDSTNQPKLRHSLNW